MNANRRKFHLGDVLSVTTEIMLSPAGLDGVHKLLDFLHGTDLMSHQLPRAARAAQPFLLQQYPGLRGVTASLLNNPSALTEDNWRDWLERMTGALGEYLEVAPIPDNWLRRRDPIAEPIEAGHEVIIVKKGPS